jgi:isopenicillin N synthase-like dioxygenase
MRLFHYLPTGAEGRDDSVLGSSAHTDWGLLTVILQDAVGGLEYLDGGVWRAVPAVEGSLVINGGDYLHLLRPALVSPIHRVLAPVDQHRMSFVFFYYPEFFTPMPSAPPAAEGREGKGGKVAFNTLLQGLPAGLQRQGQGQGQGGEGISFGAHIINKWAGVRRY